MPSPEDTTARPDVFAVSPAVGPLPAIYVSSSPNQATGPGPLCPSWPGRHGGQAAGPSGTGRIMITNARRSRGVPQSTGQYPPDRPGGTGTFYEVARDLQRRLAFIDADDEG